MKKSNQNLFILTGLILIAIFSTIFFSEFQKVNDTNPSLTNNEIPEIVNTNDSEDVQGATSDIENYIDEEDYTRGKPDAKIIFIEYSDLECPYCKRYHNTMKQVISEYGDQVLWVFRHFPLDSHPNAQKAAEAAECVGNRNGNEAFWKFTDLYFSRTISNGFGFPTANLANLASEIGSDQAEIQECLDSGEMVEKVNTDFTIGVNSGVTGTPGTIFIDPSGRVQVLSGALPYDQMKQIIDQLLSRSYN